ncbi:hypothetical protein OPIT5_24015 [Opitutaceae bacterium TAV5]|nr:hypothetical protein OPIT5_24015 [Opitutaceae bacterium TAV5]
MKSSHNTLLLLALFFAPCALLRASVQVTMATAKPTQSVIASYEALPGSAGNTTAFWRGTGPFRHIGQSFGIATKEESVRLSGVSWKIWNLDSSVEGKKFSIKLYRLTAPNKAPDPEKDLLHSEEGLLPDILEEGYYLTFTFSSSVKLAPAGAYLVLFGFEEATSKDASAKVLGFERSEGRANFDGRLWIYNGTAFVADNKAMTFFAHGQ